MNLFLDQHSQERRLKLGIDDNFDPFFVGGSLFHSPSKGIHDEPNSIGNNGIMSYLFYHHASLSIIYIRSNLFTTVPLYLFEFLFLRYRAELKQVALFHSENQISLL